MFRKWKKYGCIIFLVIALPYVITVFINGPMHLSAPRQKETEVTVQSAGDKSIQILSLDAYGMGVLAKEISMEMDVEAVKAQAVIVRTGIYKKMTESKDQKELVFTDPFYTVNEMRDEWKNKMQKYYDKLSTAWNETKGRILVYENQPAYTPYCRLTNGKTRDAAEVMGTEKYPYLKSVECEADKNAEDAFQLVEIQGTGYEITKKDSAGYVLELKKDEHMIDGDTFRDQWGLASSCYTMKAGNKKTTIITQGIGHGFGLSQNMAQELAEKGKDYKEILNYFFEGTELKEVAEILQDTE